MGTKLGTMVNSDGGTVSTNCGYTTGTHVHMYFPDKPITIDGVTFTQSDVHWGEDLYSSQGSGGCSTPSLSVPYDRWHVRVWNNRYFTGSPVDIRHDHPGDKGFSVNWGNGGPSSCTGVDNFSIKFQRHAYFASSGSYTFTTTADDGVRAFVDGVRIINDWKDQAPTTYSVQHWVDAGWRVIQVNYPSGYCDPNGDGSYSDADWTRGWCEYNDYCL